MPRFFVEPFEGSLITLTGENAKHVHVLRMHRQEELTLCDARGTDYLCRIADIDASSVTCQILQRVPSQGEPGGAYYCICCFPPSRISWSISCRKPRNWAPQRLPSSPRSAASSRPDGKALKTKLPRWEKIAASAAEQSGRGGASQGCGRCPIGRPSSTRPKPVISPCSSTSWRRKTRCTGSCLAGNGALLPSLPVLRAASVSARQPRPSRPGLLSASLGTRILRCETAPLAALSALLFAANEM